jgi:hypothetical protein
MSKTLCCPKCFSDQIADHKKGFSGRKALAGAVITGGIGLLAGTIGSNKILLTCLACGHRFKPGQGKQRIDKPYIAKSLYQEKENYIKPPIIKKENSNNLYYSEKNENVSNKINLKKFIKWIGIALLLFVGLGLLGHLLETVGVIEPTKKKSENTETAIKNPSFDTLFINKEIEDITIQIQKINSVPRSAISKFGNKKINLSTLFSDRIGLFNAAKKAKLETQIASNETDAIIISSQLPEEIKKELRKYLSSIASSYLTISMAFSTAMEYAKNGGDNSYVEAFRDDLYEGLTMYQETIEKIKELKIDRK